MITRSGIPEWTRTRLNSHQLTYRIEVEEGIEFLLRIIY